MFPNRFRRAERIEACPLTTTCQEVVLQLRDGRSFAVSIASRGRQRDVEIKHLASVAQDDDKLVPAGDFANAVWRLDVVRQGGQLDRVDPQGKRDTLGCRVKVGGVFTRCASGDVDNVGVWLPPHVEIAGGGQNGRVGLREEELLSVPSRPVSALRMETHPACVYGYNVRGGETRLLRRPPTAVLV